KNAGLSVKKATLEKAIDYIWTCHDDRTGAFTYQPRSRPGFARTAAGVCVLYLSGEAEAKDKGKKGKLTRAVEYLEDNLEARGHCGSGHSYAAHAMHQVGGKKWKDWYAKMVKEFLPNQDSDGSWSGRDRNSPGPVYQTAIAVISLSVPMHYLPIYQR